MNRFRELYRAEQFPVLQNRLFRTPEEARNCVKGDVLLAQDEETGLIFNKAFRVELVEYDSEYQNEQALSSVFREHLDDVSEIIGRYLKDCMLIEIGCGKGFFLEHLRSLGLEVTGIDPTYEGSNPRIIRQYYTPDTGLHADGIILRHVLEHVPNPVGFLDTIRESNGGKGTIYIEVPCFDWICRHRAWFDVFYEHVNYFRMADFHRMFGRVYESGNCFGGQYLYVLADLGSFRKPAGNAGDVFEFPRDFLGSVDSYVRMLTPCGRRHEPSKQSVIWGGASKGVIFALLLARAGATMDLVVDINPAKQGKYLPVTGLRVSSPQEAMEQMVSGADVFVMNGNYLNEIKQLTDNQFDYHMVEHERI